MPQSFTSLSIHAIFGTKNRLPLIVPEIRDRMYSYIGGIVGHEDGMLLAAGGMLDHVHLLFTLSPRIGLSDLMRLVKTNSSKWVHETFTDHRAFGWQDGYGAFSVSESVLGQVRDYIRDQEDHHRRMSFEEEFELFLKRHRVEFDARYLWKA
ncbi:MAG: IS200/IS605 family transposase [Planctomycetes bacterium]|nr:IS200/IS605 family transposase [Planctomycetota bacterium]